MKAHFLNFLSNVNCDCAVHVFRVGYIQHCATSTCNCNCETSGNCNCN